MYQPPQFREDRLDVQHDLVRAHPLGFLITTGDGGLTANPIPFLIEAGGTGLGILRAHIAKANPQARDLDGGAECLVVFQGPQDYVTPSWYATKRETGKVVPTWNYATVHAWGPPRLVADDAWLRRQLDDLTILKEGARPAPWAVADAPASFVAAQVKGIIGVEIPISRIEGKWKVSQNRSPADRAGVVAGLQAQNGAADPMAWLVEGRGSREIKS